MKTPENKTAMTGGERQKKYKEKNEQAVALNTLKQNFAKSKLKTTDPEKKAAQRKRDKENKQSSSEASSSDVSFSSDNEFLSFGSKLLGSTLSVRPSVPVSQKFFTSLAFSFCGRGPY